VGAEPKNVYDHLDWLETQLDYPIHRVMMRGGLTENILQTIDKKEGRVNSPPFFTRNEEGKKGMVFRQCTAEFKIYPIYLKIRELLGLKKGERAGKNVRVHQYIGISYDELQRMRISKHKWMENIYPLVDKKITRQDCFKWMDEHNYPEPPRSACTYCPYHSNAEWYRLKTQDPQSWTEAVEMDEKIRSGYRDDSLQMFVHRDAIPLKDVVFETETTNEQTTFDFEQECHGMCGL
jgi:hypothetical protein